MVNFPECIFISCNYTYNTPQQFTVLQCRDAARQEGTHAMGLCEPGQAGRSSHKHSLFVRWISLSCLALSRLFLFKPRHLMAF